MTTASQQVPDRYEFPFSDSEFARIAALAHRSFGLSLPASKKSLVYSRLARRLRALGLRDFASYCALVEGTDAGPEAEALLSALTTNVTHFFRERHHFDLLRETILPPLAARATSGGRVRIWSAGCSSGQEPYSIAIAVRAALGPAADRDVRILATDIDPAIVARARDARYTAEEIEPVPEDARRNAFVASEDGRFQVVPELRQMVSLATLNLVGDWPFAGPFDAIFCRNVAIYFDAETQARLWSGFADMLAPGGYLMIGHSERLSGPAMARFDPAGVTAYRKKPDL